MTNTDILHNAAVTTPSLLTSTNLQVASMSLLGQIFQTLRQINPDMPLQVAVTFCMVAEYPGITQVEITKLGNMSPASVSRHIAILGEYDTRRDEGFDLIRVDVDDDDRRRKLINLTPKGQIFVDRLAQIASGKR
jgi:DNA-binding MarR family transcriptional regulator